jgi:hypothetical protein
MDGDSVRPSALGGKGKRHWIRLNGPAGGSGITIASLPQRGAMVDIYAEQDHGRFSIGT